MRLMSPEYVRPYLKAQKNDDRDAEAIAEAVIRPTMRFVDLKSDEQLDMQSLHWARDRLPHLAERLFLMSITAPQASMMSCNQIRAAQHGIRVSPDFRRLHCLVVGAARAASYRVSSSDAVALEFMAPSTKARLEAATSDAAWASA